MNEYRSYFDRVNVSNTLHQRLLSGAPAEKKRTPALVRYGGMAACLALICLAGFGVWRWSTPHVGGDITAGDSLIPGEKDTYGPVETPPVLATAPPTPPASKGDEYVLTPQEAAINMPHVAVMNFEGGRELSASITMPRGAFKIQLTREEMITLLGGEDDAPWYLMWSGYDVSAEAIYDGEGRLWRVLLSGREDGVNSFHMELRPSGLPEDCVIENENPTRCNSVEVHGSKAQYGEADGILFDVRKLTFMAGEVGVSFSVTNRSGETAEFLASLAAQCYAGLPGGETLFSLSLAALDPYRGKIPEWRSETLTLSEARAEEGFGQHLPQWLPEGFTFAGAHRELGQNRDWLSADWAGYYTDINVTVHRAEFYDSSDGSGHAIPAGELTGERLEDVLQYVDSDAGDLPGWRGRFAVDYGDGFIAEYYVKGVTPQEAARLAK